MTMTPIKPARARTRQEARPEARPGRARTRSTVQDALRTKGRPAVQDPARTKGRAAAQDAPRQERTRSAAAQRGYARKAQRLAARAGVRTRTARRAPFVLLVMALLATGLITSLWLSTAATGDSYRLDDARREARDLTERAELLRQDVAAMQTAPELAQRAIDLGMVQAGEPARLVQHPDGSVEVIGKPAPATAPAPVQPPADPNQPAPAQQPAQAVPGQQPAEAAPGQQSGQPGQPAPGQAGQPPAPPGGGG